MTPREQYAALNKYCGLAMSAISGYRENLSRPDFDELQSDCFYAIFRAIEAYDVHHVSKATIETLIRRYIQQAIRHFIQHLASRRAMFESGTISADQPAYDSPEPLVNFIPGRKVDSEIDSAISFSSLLEAVETPAHQNVLWILARTKNASEAADVMELSRQRVSQIKIAAIRAVKRKIKDREDWGYGSEMRGEGHGEGNT